MAWTFFCWANLKAAGKSYRFVFEAWCRKSWELLWREIIYQRMSYLLHKSRSNPVIAVNFHCQRGRKISRVWSFLDHEIFDKSHKVFFATKAVNVDRCDKISLLLKGFRHGNGDILREGKAFFLSRHLHEWGRKNAENFSISLYSIDFSFDDLTRGNFNAVNRKLSAEKSETISIWNIFYDCECVLTDERKNNFEAPKAKWWEMKNFWFMTRLNFKVISGLLKKQEESKSLISCGID